MEWYWILSIVFGSMLVLFFLSVAFYNPFFKRFWDVILSLLALLVFSWLFVILIVVGTIAMRGNPFFIQKRPGKKDTNGKEKVFKLIKFRSMSCEKGEDGNLLPDEKRLNGYGKFLRSTSLDEFPEVLNILFGDMSIIGPRPQLIKDLVFMDDEQRKRHNVRPGLSGLAQVKGRNSISWERKIDYDLQYVQKISLFSDLKIIFLTVGTVFKKTGVVREGTSSDMDFGDWLLSERKISEEEYNEKLREVTKI